MTRVEKGRWLFDCVLQSADEDQLVSASEAEELLLRIRAWAQERRLIIRGGCFPGSESASDRIRRVREMARTCAQGGGADD